jgi:myo-inositol-1(or 4)-monophosphatase
LLYRKQIVPFSFCVARCIGDGEQSFTMELDHLTDLVIQVARRAGKTIMSSYAHVGEEEIKYKASHQDLVTQIDQTVEKQILAELREVTPEASFLGEEYGAERASSSQISWVVDPIDGTRYFARNLPMFSVSIAMTYENTPRIGVIHLPASGQTFSAYEGGGGYLDGRSLHGSQISSISEAIVYVDAHQMKRLPQEQRSWFEVRILDLIRTCYRVRMIGSSSIATTWMATGAVDAFVDLTGQMPVWDMLAPQVIMSETGARQEYLQIGGGSPKFVAANPHLWGPVLDLLTKPY